MGHEIFFSFFPQPCKNVKLFLNLKTTQTGGGQRLDNVAVAPPSLEDQQRVSISVMKPGVNGGQPV